MIGTSLSENSEDFVGAPQHPPTRAEATTPGIRLLDMLLIAAEGKTKLAAITIVCTLIGIFFAFFIKPTYSAKALIMPPQAPQSSLSSLMGQLGSLSALGGGASSLLKNPADLYVGILQSETIANQAITTFHLQDRWHTKSMYESRKRLEGHIQFEAAKNGLIEITAKEDNPQKASDLANFYVDALYRMNSTLAVSEASQRRLFFDQQLSSERSALESAEEDLKNTQQKTGILTITGQAQLAVQTIAQTEAQIASKEIQLQAIRAYGTEDNPDVVRLKEEIATQQRQLSAMEDNQRRMSPGDTQIAANQFSAGSLDYLRKLRDVKYHETLYQVLSRQYEAARVDEAKAAPIIQVVDRANPPDHKSGPPRLLIIIGSAVCGFLIGYGWVFFAYNLEQARQTPAIASKLNRLRTQLTWHRT